MKKWNSLRKVIRQSFCICLMGTLLMGILLPECVKANTKTYTITIRAGNVGTFKNLEETDSYSITANYIRIKNVTKGTTLLEAFQQSFQPSFSNSSDLNDWFSQQLTVKKGYLLKDAATWINLSDTVEKNEEYVLDYVVSTKRYTHKSLGTKYAAKMDELIKSYMKEQNAKYFA